MKRKLVSITLGIIMVFSMTTAAFATTVDQDSSGNTGTTAVTLNVAPAYTVTIPATVELTAQGNDPETYADDLEITADAGVRLDEGMQITVTLSGNSWDDSTNSFYLTSDTAVDYKLAYTVKVNGTAIENDGVVAEFETSSSAQTSTLRFEAEDPEYAGDYSDTVTFTLAVEAQQ